MIWRLDKDVAGSGVAGDLVSHLLDTARYLIGDFAAVTALTKVFVEERDFQSEDAKGGKKRRKGRDRRRLSGAGRIRQRSRRHL